MWRRGRGREGEGTYEAVVEGSGQVLEVEPDVERRLGRDRDLQTETRQTPEDVVALVLEVLLQRDLLRVHVPGFEQRDRRQLQATTTCSE